MENYIFSDDCLKVFETSLNENFPQNNDYKVLQEIFKSNLPLFLVF